MKSIIATFFTIIIAVVLMAMMSKYQEKSKPWDIPTKFKQMQNTVKPSDASIKEGYEIYKKNCMVCHGKTGMGDGVKAKNLETFPGNLTSSEFQSQPDGYIFYESKIGRNEMPKYEGKLEDSEIWNVINYIRTLKK